MTEDDERQYFRANRKDIGRDELSDRVQAGEQLRRPEEVPRFDGTGEGHMQGRILPGSEAQSRSGVGNQGNKGTEVYGASELPGTNDPHGNGEYGSASVVSLNELAPAEEELDPGLAPEPQKQRTAQQILAEMRQRKH